MTSRTRLAVGRRPRRARRPDATGSYPAGWVPAYDPFLATRGRASLVAGRERQQAIWRATANLGVVVAGPRVIGTWRGRTRNRRYDITIPTSDHRPRILDAVEGDAHAIATARSGDWASLTSE